MVVKKKSSLADSAPGAASLGTESDGEAAVDGEVRLRTAHEDFIVYLKGANRATSTVLAYGKDIEQLVEFCATEYQLTHVHHVKFQHLDGFKEHLHALNYTPKSVSRKINSIKTFFRFLHQYKKVIDDDPAVTIRHPQYSTAPPRILSEMEYRALRDAARSDVRISAIIELLLQTGIRIGELANLELADIGENELVVRAYESHGSRTIPLNRAVRAALDHYLEVRPKIRSKKLFITKTGRPMLVRNIRTAIDRYFKLAGLKNVKVNDLRHTWIAHQLTAGVPLVLVSRLAGHKRLSTTEKYLKYIAPTLDSSKVQLKEL